MEILLQKYMKYIYITLIGVILIQMLDVLFVTILTGVQIEMIIVMFLSVMNMILLGSSLKYLTHQRFMECKSSTKILRFTIFLLMVFQAMLSFKGSLNWIVLGNHLLAIVVIEIVLEYRIKSIEHLETLAEKFTKSNMLNKKGE